MFSFEVSLLSDDATLNSSKICFVSNEEKVESDYLESPAGGLVLSIEQKETVEKGSELRIFCWFF